jgi:N utilization substance protein B
MPSRHRSRERALQILFLWDVSKLSVDDAIEAFYETLYSEEGYVPPQSDEFITELVRGVTSHAASIDESIVRHAEHWRIERMPAVDRNILRLAIYEMVHAATPPPVAIDEARELARRFAGDESVQFVNGVLDAVRKEAEKQEPEEN